MPCSKTHNRNRWLVQLCTLTAFVWSLAWVSSAAAAVPMCGVHAQTIAAPPIGTPASSDSLSVGSPCQPYSPLQAASVPQRDAPEKLSLPELPIRALPILPRRMQPPNEGQLLPLAEDDAPVSAGFAGSIERPPRG
jgi:hypothetical protein